MLEHLYAAPTIRGRQWKNCRPEGGTQGHFLARKQEMQSEVFQLSRSSFYF